MAFSASRFNKENKFDFRTPDDFKFTTLDEQYTQNGEKTVYPVKALYINTKSVYGNHPVVVTDKALVDVPKHLLDTVKEMIDDDECVNAINNGKVGFTIYTYIDKKYHKTCYSVKWVDM